jgi:hypothetical protein
VREVRVRSWSELNDALYAGSWQPGLGRFRSPLAFRGSPDARLPVRSGITRLGPHFARVERRLLANFRKYAHRDGSPDDSVWSWLAVAQHHGLPTRLVDWTYSPYVAAHFATEAPDLHRDIDAVIWCVDYVRAHSLLPTRLRRILAREEAQVFTPELLGEAARSLPEFDRLAAKEFVVFLEPPSLDQRIVNQFALFSIVSSARADIGAWLRRHPGVARRIVIPAAAKWEVRDKLDQANVNERVLFPGLDGLALWLTRYYAERPPPPHHPVRPSVRRPPAGRRR